MPLPPLSVGLPSDDPTISWSVGEIVALTLTIYPDAWTRIAGKPESAEIPDALLAASRVFSPEQDIEDAFNQFCAAFIPACNQSRKTLS